MISKEYVDALIEAINQRINPLQKSPDFLFDIVSSNGIRPFRVRSNDGVIEFESIAKLVTGDSALISIIAPLTIMPLTAGFF